MKTIISILAVLILITCGCISSGKVLYPSYRINDNAHDTFSKNKAVYIAPIEQFSTRISNFQDVYGTVQSEIEGYMQKNGFNVLSSGRCEEAFIRNISRNGGFYNQQTGKMDSSLLQKCIDETIAELKQESEFSAIVMPFLVFSPLSLKKPYTSGVWDGVKRKVKIYSTSRMSFSPIQTMSIKLIVISNDGDWVFESIGGIDFVQKVKEVGSVSDRSVGLITKDPDEFSIEDIREGIEIAFHPFILSQKIGDAKEKR